MKKIRFFYGKVFSTFQKWTKKMSKIEKLKHFTPKKYLSQHNLKLWSKHKKNNFHFVTINFFYFYKKYLKIFS